MSHIQKNEMDASHDFPSFTIEGTQLIKPVLVLPIQLHWLLIDETLRFQPS
jgi:hypothetical protein